MTGTFWIGRDRNSYKFFKGTLKNAPKCTKRVYDWGGYYFNWNRDHEFSLCGEGFKKYFGQHILEIGEVCKFTLVFACELEKVSK